MGKVSIILLALLVADSVRGAVRHSVGVARTAEQEVKYIEHHQYLEDGMHRVNYFDPEFNLLLTKELTYPANPQHPNLVQTDPIGKTNLRIEQESGIGLMTMDKKRKNFRFDLSEDVIIDAGFDGYIRSKWDELSTDSEQDIRMVVAGVPNLISMTIALIDRTEQVSRFSIKPRSWLLRFVLPEIQLEYDPDRQLMKYEGLTNLKPAGGGSRKVAISFTHHESDTPLDLPPRDWLSL